MKKRVLALLMTSVLMLSALFTGCGRDDAESGNGKTDAGEGPWYKAKYHDFVLEEEEYTSAIAVWDKAIYFLTNKYVEESGSSVTRLNKMTLPDFEMTQIKQIELEEEHFVTDMFVNDAGVFLTTQYTKWDDSYMKLIESQYSILKCDFEGNVLETFDITKDMQNKAEDGMASYISDFVCDGENNFIVTDDQSFVMAFDAAGQKLMEIPIKGWGQGLNVTKEGKVYYSYTDDNTWEHVLAPVDVKNGKIGESLGNLGEYNSSVSFMETDKLLWISEENELNTYNVETEEETEVLDWIDYDVNGNDIRVLQILEDGTILAFVESYGEEQWTYEVILLEKTDEPIDTKTILTYATLGTDHDVMDAIIRFNKNNEEYRIKVVDYYDEQNYETSVDEFSEAILNGTAADIINVDWSRYKSMARKGLYADLNEFMDKDSDIKRSDYFENVLDAYEVDGKLYAMPMAFGVTTLVGKTSVWGEESGISWAEFYKKMQEMPKDTEMMDMMTKNQWLFMALQGTIDHFVNWETGECSFDSEEFVRILETANQFPEEYDYEGQNMSTPEKVQAGKAALYNDNWTEVTGYQVTKAIFNDEITAVGYPGVDGNGSLIQNMGSLFAISEQSSYKDGAWEFVKYMISEDYQKNYVRWYNPIHKAAFEKQMESAMEAEYYTDEKGEKVESPKMTYGWDNFEVSVYAATKEEVAAYKAVLEGATVLASYEEEIMTMISEEVEPFFKGQKSAKDVAGIIQGRVKIYVNESR